MEFHTRQNVEKPGVSAIYVSVSSSYKQISVVVFFPRLFFWLISPSWVTFSLNKSFISVDFPTPEFPANALILFFNSNKISSIPMPFFASVCITLYPISSYIFEYLKIRVYHLNQFCLEQLRALYVKTLQKQVVYLIITNQASDAC